MITMTIRSILMKWCGMEFKGTSGECRSGHVIADRDKRYLLFRDRVVGRRSIWFDLFHQLLLHLVGQSLDPILHPLQDQR